MKTTVNSKEVPSILPLLGEGKDRTEIEMTQIVIKIIMVQIIHGLNSLPALHTVRFFIIAWYQVFLLK